MRAFRGGILTTGLAVLLGVGALFQAGEPVPGDLPVARLLGHPKMRALGEQLFFDERLSEPPGQSCATCHDPATGWTGPDSALNARGGILPGAVPDRFGNRKPPSAAYATYSPRLHARLEEGEVLFVGGAFWDGRATGHLLGNAAADQAQGPFLDPLEQNLSGAEDVVRRVEAGPYGAEFREVLGEVADLAHVDAREATRVKFGIVALALAAFEHSPRLNVFTSKYDAYLKGRARLTRQEALGLKVFEVKGKCADCHPSRPGPRGEPPLFTDFTFDNLGIPRNPENPWYRMPPEFNPEGAAWIDRGLGGFLAGVPQYSAHAAANLGKHRVPTLRNVDLRPGPDFVKAYGHNGYFKDLESIVHFYNTRDVKRAADPAQATPDGVRGWAPPEVTDNLNRDEMGDLKLTAAEEAALVAFLRTLSDGYVPPPRGRRPTERSGGRHRAAASRAMSWAPMSAWQPASPRPTRAMASSRRKGRPSPVLWSSTSSRGPSGMYRAATRFPSTAARWSSA